MDSPIGFHWFLHLYAVEKVVIAWSYESVSAWCGMQLLLLAVSGLTSCSTKLVPCLFGQINMQDCRKTMKNRLLFLVGSHLTWHWIRMEELRPTRSECELTLILHMLLGQFLPRTATQMGRRPFSKWRRFFRWLSCIFMPQVSGFEPDHLWPHTGGYCREDMTKEFLPNTTATQTQIETWLRGCGHVIRRGVLSHCKYLYLVFLNIASSRGWGVRTAVSLRK